MTTPINDDELDAVIYTELLEYSEPTSVSEMCDKLAGLMKKQDRVATMLLRMCDSDMVVNVGGKYILKEKWIPHLDRNSSSLTYDGPAHGTTCSNRHNDGVNHKGRLSTVLGAVGENSVIAPQASIVAQQSPSLVQRTSRSSPQASREMVPVRHSVVRRSSSSDSTCDVAAQEKNRDTITKILDLLKQTSCPLKGKDIAQRTGLGQAKSDVNRYLYFLEKQNILKKIGQTEWQLVSEVKDEDVQVYAAQLAKIPTAKSKGKQSAGSAGSSCLCPNAGQGCTHITNNFQQNFYNTYYNMQVGENNQMMSAPPPDGAPHGGGN